MNESENDVDVGPLAPRPFLSSRGRPERPLVEVFVVMFALYLAAYLPADVSKLNKIISQPVFFLYTIVEMIPRIVFFLYLMAVTDGLGAFKVRPPRAVSFIYGTALTLVALVIVFGLGAILSLFGVVNPLTQGVKKASIVLLPLIILASTATGYSEELCFRAYLLHRFSQAGLGTGWSIALSTLVFAGAHGAQGIAGPVVAGAIGFVFAWRFSKQGDLNEIAIAHAAYNSIMFVVLLYS
jgi:hypothetical protein